MIKMSIIYIYILIMRIYYINPFVGLLTGCQQAYTPQIFYFSWGECAFDENSQENIYSNVNIASQIYIARVSKYLILIISNFEFVLTLVNWLNNRFRINENFLNNCIQKRQQLTKNFTKSVRNLRYRRVL